MSEPVVELRDITKRYGTVRAVDGVSLTVQRGEFFALLGPSGCGKTTTLRLLAGLEVPDAGEVRLLGERVNERRPYQRPVAMVFQNYALFPHLDVARNVGFGLVERAMPASDIARQVLRALELVRLDPATYAGRRPAELSGGQRQRVALARALVLEPAILLLDEPLGALDLKLRKEMQLELKALNRQLGMTFVFVTHDQQEALAMSDRIAVMDQGRIAQVGTPAEVYETPRTAFVAQFIGECNVVAGHDGPPLAIRPEWLTLRPSGGAQAGEASREGTIRDIVYLGETLHVVLRDDAGADLRIAVPNDGQIARPLAWQRGDRCAACWQSADAVPLEAP